MYSSNPRDRKKDAGLYVPLISSTSPNLQPNSLAQEAWASSGPSSAALSHQPSRPTQQQRPPGSAPSRSKNPSSIAPGQPAPAARQRDKFVPLPDEEGDDPHNLLISQQQQLQASSLDGALTPSIFEDLPSSQLRLHPTPPPEDKRGRITLYCVAESFDRKKLDELLKMTYAAGSVMSYPDCFYVDYLKYSEDDPGADLFFFDYGVVACWGMTKNQEWTVVRGIAAQVQVRPLVEKEIEIDEFEYNFSATEKPHVRNDTVTLHRRFARDHKMKLAISYALSQSAKLSVYERNVVGIVLETKNLPESLAETGEVDISGHDIAKLIGKVFLQKSAVNLLSSVLDTPEFFWHAPDSFLTLYKRLNEYLELPERVELLNSRFSVLQEMLDMLRDHQNNCHSVRLEWTVIWLIVIEVVVGVLEVLGLFGMVGSEKK
ncbi:hypothetical protein CEUSTIGMA_g8563.t1 [Chlamydomonas eustigma]|uniref:DUF155 domain-containing protein n=1 Tax=Chlamydomonas eustigma TaxID=1157962 RepID=A0A250XDZ3_9CHLO|nr:hypothetical protein CEUSTIGMA_g8563.t1 [Chlamydomonas eustigma]|eukprot:GAX81129.1 hypothetical protein CEUSTIGMA_g8563.t1 [Chlamydomonas eustigma]